MSNSAPEKNHTQITYPKGAQEKTDKYDARPPIGLALRVNHDDSGAIPAAPQRLWGFVNYAGPNNEAKSAPVTAFVNPVGEKNDKPYLNVVERTPGATKDADGAYPKSASLGKFNAVNTEGGAPLAADRTPYLLGNVTVEGKSVMMRAYVMPATLPLMPALGFSADVIKNFELKVAAKEEAAKKASPKL